MPVFGSFDFDSAARRLARDGEEIHLRPKAFSLLELLLEAAPRVVPKREIHDRLWPRGVVSDATLVALVKELRRALDDRDAEAPIIRTAHRVGYALNAEASKPPARRGAHWPHRTGYRFVTPHVTEMPLVAAAARCAADTDLAQIVAQADVFDAPDLTLPSQPSVAVLPFRLVSDAEEHSVLADGLTHEVITRTARARWLFVISRGSAFKFRSGPYDAREVGRALGVRYVVQGQVRVVGGTISVQAVLEDATTGRERWAEHLRRPLQDILSIQEDIAELVVGSIEAEIEHAERERAAVKSPASLDAWGAYYRGCWHMYRFTPKDYEHAEQFFQRSIELDPRSPRAYAGLSFIHWQRAFLELVPDRDAAARRALELAQESLALDTRDPLGHWALGRAYLLDHDLDEAVDELETSVALNPSSAVGQYSLSYALMQTGDSQRSNAIVAKARRLSPYDAMTFAMHAVRAQNLAFLGNHAESANLAARAARQPNAHYQVLAIAAYCNVLAERTDAAKGFYTQLKAVRPAYTSADFLRAFRHQPRANTALVERAFKRLTALR